jgi:hypothetical protein
MADEKAIKPKSKKQWESQYNLFQRLFAFEDDNFTEFLDNFTDDHIAEILDTAYPNPSTRIKSYNFIPKLYNMMGERFQSFLTKARYDIWNKMSHTVGDINKAKNDRKKNSTGTNFIPMILETWKNELKLRKTALGSAQHALAVLYTLGIYEDLKKLDKPTIIARLYYGEFTLVDEDSLINKGLKQNFYNIKTGRMVLRELKTDQFYTYDFFLNPVAKHFIDIYISQNNKKAGDKFFNKSKMSEGVNAAILIGSREYRRGYQSIFGKIFKVPIEDLSDVFAHDVNTALSGSYTDSYVYTEAERKKALTAFKKQVAQNAKF